MTTILDENASSALIQHGLFSVSRNPIFLGSVLIQIQVRLEEASLSEKYGDAYRKYQMRVRRWI